MTAVIQISGICQNGDVHTYNEGIKRASENIYAGYSVRGNGVARFAEKKYVRVHDGISDFQGSIVHLQDATEK